MDYGSCLSNSSTKLAKPLLGSSSQLSWGLAMDVLWRLAHARRKFSRACQIVLVTTVDVTEVYN